jgi:hypothetical protein
MKRVALLGVLAAMLFFSAQAASAQEVSGTYCVTLNITEDDDGPTNQTIDFKIKLTPVKTGYGMAHGYFKPPDSGPVVMGGTYQSVGTLLYMNLVLTQKISSSEREAGVVQVTINKSTLKGSFFVIGHEFDRTTRQFGQNYSAGSVALRRCQ